MEREPPGGPADDPDWAVLRRVAAGDVDCFRELVERHQDRLVRVCDRLLGDRDEARDAAQEVFLRAFRKAGSYHPRGQVFTWLYRIAVNLCLNTLRRRRLARFLSLSPAAGEDEPAIEPRDERADAAGALLARERWRITRRALDRLPPTQRAVLVLARFEGLSQREIAAALGITEGAVESRLVRAMRTLEAAQEKLRSRVPRPARR
jgi:RNA polymerase sigma-70 factor (ECF subfamily)